MLATAAVMAAMASAGNGTGGSSSTNGLKAYVQTTLLSAIQQNPKGSFDVIVEGADRKAQGHGLVQKILGDKSGAADETVGQGNVKKEFLAIDGAQLTLTGKQILHLARTGIASAILPNDQVKRSGIGLSTYNTQLWSWSTGAVVDWLNVTPKAPTIAIVDSGLDPAHSADFGTRVLGQVNLASLTPNSAGDGYGHGTFVAGIAAGQAAKYAGAAPTANLLPIDVMNDNGEATVSDVVSACDWIMQNKAAYNIKVANFSLHSVNRASVFFDPIDQAVEKLWLNGVVVVAAAGNYAVDGAESGVEFAPGNDPFVITVGAADTMGTATQSDDTAAPWSAWGYSPDGFMKPEVSAPGRYMIGPVTADGVLATERPDKVVAPGYMQLSGTSFAAPVVSAVAAMLAAQHPTWSTGQIKGAIMLTSSPTAAPLGQLGVGEVNVFKARVYAGTPPNPNAALLPFVTTATDGTRVFDSAAWQSAALGNAAWSDAAWSDAAWASAAWGDAAWSDAAWSDAAWSDAAWSDGSQADDPVSTDSLATDQTTQDATEADLGIIDPNCDPTVSVCTLTTDTTTSITP